MTFKVVIPAAGNGTRMRELTNGHPKELLKIGGIAALDHVIAESIAMGADELVVISSRNKHPLNRALARMAKSSALGEVKLTVVDQHEPSLLERFRRLTDEKVPHGLGFAVYCANQAVGDSPFVLALPDDIIRSQDTSVFAPASSILLASLASRGLNGVATMTVPQADVHNYGIVEINTQHKGQPGVVTSFIEKPNPGQTTSREAIVGRYALQPEIFKVIEQMLGEYRSGLYVGKGDEIQLTDAFASLEERTSAFMGVELELLGDRRFDTGNPEGFGVFKTYIESNITQGNHPLNVAQATSLMRSVASTIGRG